MLYIVQEEINGIWGASVLSDPKRIEWLVDGTVAVREHLPANVERQLLFDSQQDQFTDWVGHGAWVAEADGTITVPISEDDHFFINTLWGRGLAWEAEFLLSTTSVASLIVRGNPSTMAGYRIGLDSERGVVGLYRLFPAQPETIIQERAVALASDQWHNLKIVVQGDFLMSMSMIRCWCAMNGLIAKAALVSMRAAQSARRALYRPRRDAAGLGATL